MSSASSASVMLAMVLAGMEFVALSAMARMVLAKYPAEVAEFGSALLSGQRLALALRTPLNLLISGVEINLGMTMRLSPRCDSAMLSSEVKFVMLARLIVLTLAF